MQLDIYKKIELLEKLLEDKAIISSENLNDLNQKFDLIDDYFIDGAGI